MPPCCSAGGIFSVALSVTEPHRVELSSTPHAEACNSALQRSLRGRPLALPGALPLFVTGSCEPTTTVSGLSSRPDCSRPAITRPVRQFHYRTQFGSPRRTQRAQSQRIRMAAQPKPGPYGFSGSFAGLCGAVAVLRYTIFFVPPSQPPTTFPSASWSFGTISSEYDLTPFASSLVAISDFSSSQGFAACA